MTPIRGMQALFWGLLAPGMLLIVATPLALAQYPQWGGPDRNFLVDTTGLAESWPAEGPKTLWRRKLGTGYSAIAVSDGMLFTMYRKSKPNRSEYTIALDAATGETIWKKRSLAGVPEETADHGKEFSGPNATPLVVGDRVFTVGRNARLHCFQKGDGTILWKHKLLKKFDAEIQTCGYSCSPIAYGNTVIVPLGRAEGDDSEGNSLIAFDQSTGDVAWRSQTFSIDHSSPILIKLEGEDQLVQCTDDSVIGVAPSDGALLWKYRYPDPEEYQGLFATPVWDSKDVIMFSSRESATAIRLVKNEGVTKPEVLWSDKQAAMGMATPVLMGDMLVGAKRSSRGMDSPVMAVDTATGERLWVKRGFPSAVSIGGGGRLIVLDHTGKLGLATVTREDFTVRSEHQLTEQWSFTAPTLVGTILYVRDEKDIMALDLGKIVAEAG